MKASLQYQGKVMIVILALQYILGMAAMAFVKFPESATAAQYWDFANSQWLLVAHMGVATGLVIGAVIVLVRAFLQKNTVWKIAATVGFVSIIVAGLGGERFVSTQSDIWSLVMGLGFLAAFLSYGWAIYSSKQIA